MNEHVSTSTNSIIVKYSFDQRLLLNPDTILRKLRSLSNQQFCSLVGEF